MYLAAVLAAYILLLLLVRPLDYIDTFNYAKHIAEQDSRLLPQRENPFWDFGHVLWRPLGYLVWSPLRGWLSYVFHGDDILGAGSVLIALNVVGGAAGATFLFLLVAATTRNKPVAAVVTIGYLSTDALLFYSLTGMTYITGLACQIAAIYVIERAPAEGPFTFARGAAAGSLLGLSVVVWFPYSLSLAGIFGYAWLRPDSARRPPIRGRAPGLVGLIAGVALVMLLVYGSVIAICRFTTVQAVSDWIARSRYDRSAPNRGLLRMVGSMPRAFLSLGHGSTEWKRILFEGRSLSLLALLRTGIWKVALVYATLAFAVVALARSSGGRRLLLCLLAIAAPLAIFAIFLFEASAHERYIAAFPLLFLGFAWIIADPRSGKLARLALPVFFACMLVTNLADLFRFRSDAELEAAGLRVQALNRKVTPEDCIVLESYQDDALRLVNSRPFSPLSRNRYLYYVGVPVGTAADWKRRLAERVERAWDHGGHVWFTERFLAAAPDPAWGWVEGDDPRFRFADFRAFFASLDRGESTGGADGFSEIARTEKNKSLFRAILLNR